MKTGINWNLNTIYKYSEIHVYTVNTMSTETITARVPPKDKESIEFLIESGEFKSKSDFFRYAVKHTLSELIQKELDTLTAAKTMDDKELERIHKTIKEVRRNIWSKKYAKRIS